MWMLLEPTSIAASRSEGAVPARELFLRDGAVAVEFISLAEDFTAGM
jgi:hypothetical protein